jgi:hypothetical protein
MYKLFSELGLEGRLSFLSFLRLSKLNLIQLFDI